MLCLYDASLDGTIGFKYLLARCLLTVSLEGAGMKEASRYLADIRSRAILHPCLQRKLEVWLENVPASNFFTVLSLDKDRFQKLLDREITRLERPEIIQNTVRERICLLKDFFLLSRFLLFLLNSFCLSHSRWSLDVIFPSRLSTRMIRLPSKSRKLPPRLVVFL